MSAENKFDFDEIGYWSEIKLDIIRKYASAYSRILSNQKWARHIYIDAFAGAGKHISKKTGEYILGSPLNSLNIQPPFFGYHFIDIDANKIDHLKDLLDVRRNVHLYPGDCNVILMNEIFPSIEKNSACRALCLLDPYGLHYKWTVIERAGKMKKIDMFLNFPIMAMNRNILWRNPEGVSPSQIQLMTDSWGDDSWKEAAYSKKPPDIFNYQQIEKESNEAIVAAFRKRLQEVAEFQFVPEPIPMRNSNGATIYYLFFASPKEVAQKIIKDIFAKYRDRGAV